jgi:ATPases involved in chromosome partitioning
MIAKVIVLANQKGGTGKTTTAVNLATGLAMAGHKVILIDLDQQGNATTGLGVDKWKLQRSVYNVLVNGLELKDVALHTQIENLDLVPANMHLAAAELELINRLRREYTLREKIDALTDYEYIIVDTPPNLGLITTNALVAATTIMVPVQTEYYAMEGMTQLLKVVEMIKKGVPECKANTKYLLTMFDGRTNVSKEVANQIKEYFGAEVFNAVIPRNIKLSEAPSFGKPIFQYDPYSVGATSYGKLVEEVLKWP